MPFLNSSPRLLLAIPLLGPGLPACAVETFVDVLLNFFHGHVTLLYASAA